MELKAIKTYIKDLEEDKSCDNITDFGEQILRELYFVVKENDSKSKGIYENKQISDCDDSYERCKQSDIC